MNLSRPIPKTLLPHTVSVITPTEGIYCDRWGHEIQVHNVRVEFYEKVRMDKLRDTITKGARVYYDCVNSKPANLVFTTNQTIAINSEHYKVESVKAVMAADKIHHYRIDVI